MKKIEIIGICAGACELVQMYLLGGRSVYGFAFGIVACLLWMIYARLTWRAVGLWLIAPIGLILNVRGILNWLN